MFGSRTCAKGIVFMCCSAFKIGSYAKKLLKSCTITTCAALFQSQWPKSSIDMYVHCVTCGKYVQRFTGQLVSYSINRLTHQTKDVFKFRHGAQQ